MNTLHLTAADVKRIEEGMATEDLEHMVAVVDRIVSLRLKKALKVSVAACVK